MVIFSFSRKNVPFFSDLLILSFTLKEFLYARALFNNFLTLPMISRLSPRVTHSSVKFSDHKPLSDDYTLKLFAKWCGII